VAAVRLQLVCRTFKMFIVISFVQYIDLVNLGYVLCIFVHVMHVPYTGGEGSVHSSLPKSQFDAADVSSSNTSR